MDYTGNVPWFIQSSLGSVDLDMDYIEIENISWCFKDLSIPGWLYLDLGTGRHAGTAYERHISRAKIQAGCNQHL